MAAKKRRKARKASRKRRHRTGAVVTARTRRMSGLGKLGKLNNPRSITGAVVPPLVGGGVAALVTIGLKSMTQQQQQAQAQAQAQQAAAAASGQQQGLYGGGYLGAAAQQQGAGMTSMLHKWAPLLGIGGGALASVLMSSLAGKSAGYGALAGSVGVGGSLAVYMLMSDVQQQQAAQQQGLAAVVAEYGQGPMGALVMEPNADQGYNAYSGGADLSINGLGGRGTGSAVDPSAFGTQAF